MNYLAAVKAEVDEHIDEAEEIVDTYEPDVDAAVEELTGELQ